MQPGSSLCSLSGLLLGLWCWGWRGDLALRVIPQGSGGAGSCCEQNRAALQHLEAAVADTGAGKSQATHCRGAGTCSCGFTGEMPQAGESAQGESPCC